MAVLWHLVWEARVEGAGVYQGACVWRRVSRPLRPYYVYPLDYRRVNMARAFVCERAWKGISTDMMCALLFVYTASPHCVLWVCLREHTPSERPLHQDLLE